MSASVQSLIDYGTDGLVVDVECHLSNNLPNIVIVGYANKAVDEARERVRGAFVSSRLELPRKRITINLAPADVPKASSSFDLGVAAAIIQAAADGTAHRKTTKIPSEAGIEPAAARLNGARSAVSPAAAGAETGLAPGTPPPAGRQLGKHEAVMGELGLDGGVRPVRGIIGKILAGRSRGITTFYIPAANLPQARLVPGVTLVPLARLSELHDYLRGRDELERLETGAGTPDAADSRPAAAGGTAADAPLSLSDVIGQAQAKRALEIAAAGGHNVLLNGPPGTGKSMLARTLPSILPPLTGEEMLEVTHLHSLASREYDRLITRRPFRAPHHSASLVAIVGGGTVLRPGEISLSHRGVLFFDELPEFNRAAIEALRQPLEDRQITIARANDRLQFPADFILVATSNPCPCGYYGLVQAPDAAPGSANIQSRRVCECAPAVIQRYRAKLSGPILDRIDLYSEVQEVDHANLLAAPKNGSRTTGDEAVRGRVLAARRRQAARFGDGRLNAAMTNRDLTKYARLTADAKQLLDAAGRNLGLSARAYLRAAKVARTIADLADSEQITAEHVSEALQYRSRGYQP